MDDIQVISQELSFDGQHRSAEPNVVQKSFKRKSTFYDNNDPEKYNSILNPRY